MRDERTTRLGRSRRIDAALAELRRQAAARRRDTAANGARGGGVRAAATHRRLSPRSG
jgi:hypothetical protein